MQRTRLAPLVLAVAALLAACSSETTSSPHAAATLVTSKTALRVGDTMLVKAGLRYEDGRFTEFTNYTVSVVDTNFARVLTGTRIVEAKEFGSAVVRVTIPQNATFRIDSAFPVDVAP